MNVITSTWRQLVRRRLWPVALLLLAALAAVPMLLVREAETPAPGRPLALKVEPDDTIAEPVVAAATPEERSRRRRVLGVRKDPFRPAPAEKPKAVEAKTSASEPKQATEHKSVSLPEPVTTGGGGAVPAPTAPIAPAEPKRYYSPGTIIVRLGDPESGDGKRFAVKKLEPVPSADEPLLIYVGLTKNGKRAKFLVDASVEVDGDAVCKPHPSNCEQIELSVGETEFLDVVDPEAAEDDENRVTAQFQLDLVDIKRAGDADVK
jgi:hypothetical protein